MPINKICKSTEDVQNGHYIFLILKYFVQMKKIIVLLIVIAIASCNNKSTENETNDTKAVKAQNPCELFDVNQLANVFNIADNSLIEMYSHDKYENTKQCQFIWQEKAGSIEASQIMIDITHKTENMGTTFSRMLALDLKNGLTALENNQTIIIKPTPLNGFGNFAYHWEQPSFQNVQKIAFQVDNNYRVVITFNCHKNIKVSQNEIKNRLIKIGTIIKEKL